MAEFSGVRITGFDTYDVVVKNEGYTYVLAFCAAGRIRDNDRRPYGAAIEEAAAKGFHAWCEKRKISHFGTDMA